MKYLKTYDKLFEMSSTLTRLGIPRDVMQFIQRNYEISLDAKWQRITNKSEIKQILQKNEKGLIISMTVDKITIICIKYVDGEKIYTTESFNYDDSSWGEFKKQERREESLTQVINALPTKSLFWYLNEGTFEVQAQPVRRLKKQQMEFDSTTLEFKIKLVKNFNRIIKQLYGYKSELIKKKIINKIEELPIHLDDIAGENWKKEILDLINNNVELQKLSDQYDTMRREDDILGLEKLEKQYNSLTIFDEYLINFEVLYSEEYDTHLTIQDLLEEFGWYKIMTSFMYFLYTGKIMKL